MKVIARLFRRLFREALLDAIDKGEVQTCAELIEPMRRALLEKKWVVYAKAPFGGAEQVFAYLGRYRHRVGISNARILGMDERAAMAAQRGSCRAAPVASRRSVAPTRTHARGAPPVFFTVLARLRAHRPAAAPAELPAGVAQHPA